MTLSRPFLKLAAAGLCGALLLPACAESGGRGEMERIVREYILANPEIVEEALLALTEKEKAAEAGALREAILANQDKLYNLEGDFSTGPADAPITVVEFFDYRCGFCKRSAEWVSALPETYDGEVRVVFKELPIFGGISESAARAALAAGRQGLYLDMHMALMRVTSNEELTEEKIDALAREVGVDVARMRADMDSESVTAQLDAAGELAEALNVRGTPGFFIGDEAVEGANIPLIQKIIDRRLAG